ncbi:hypothetical protein LINGRAHAP2_LOCUS11799 [Linum grandiflorum]
MLCSGCSPNAITPSTFPASTRGSVLTPIALSAGPISSTNSGPLLVPLRPIRTVIRVQTLMQPRLRIPRTEVLAHP